MAQDSGWSLFDLPHALVVMPEEDIVEHTQHEKCACNPLVEHAVRTVYGDCGPKARMRKIIRHAAMDGRTE